MGKSSQVFSETAARTPRAKWPKDAKMRRKRPKPTMRRHSARNPTAPASRRAWRCRAGFDNPAGCVYTVFVYVICGCSDVHPQRKDLIMEEPPRRGDTPAAVRMTVAGTGISPRYSDRKHPALTAAGKASDPVSPIGTAVSGRRPESTHAMQRENDDRRNDRL